MKKIILFLLMMSPILSFAELPQFEIDEQSGNEQNSNFEDRLNASQQLILVLPSSYYNELSKTYWDNITNLLCDHCSKSGLKLKYFRTPFVPANNVTFETPGTVKNSTKIISYEITNQKYYKYSDLIVFPELYGDGFSVVWKYIC